MRTWSVLSILIAIIGIVAITACGGTTSDEHVHTPASFEAPDSIDRDIRSVSGMEAAGGERLAQSMFDGGVPIEPPSGFDAGGLPFGPDDAGVPPFGISDSGTTAPFGYDAGISGF